MPYKRIEPATEEEMFRDCHPGHYSICQYLRDIYRDVPEAEDKQRERVRYCWAWAKRMHKEIKKLHIEKADRYCRELELKEKNSDSGA